MENLQLNNQLGTRYNTGNRRETQPPMLNCCNRYGHILLHISVYHKITKFANAMFRVKLEICNGSPITKSRYVAKYQALQKPRFLGGRN